MRLEATERALDDLAAQVHGEPIAVAEARAWWSAVREQQLAHFRQPGPLWRLHVPLDAPLTAFERLASFAFEWNGAQRWVSGLDAEAALVLARDCAGHATCFRGAAPTDEVFAPLPAGLLELHRRVKRVFDPAGILNPGRLYAVL